ncbi:MAG: glycoside hydrolase family 88 protein [Eubacteriales bacterium]|nr:glycoside hydrolase family 88 protein [Eubacteriales bacterium]
MGIVFDREQVLTAITSIVERTMQMDMVWDWPCGVAYYGISEAYQVTHNEAYLRVMKARVDELIALGLPPQTINSCAMGHCLLTLNEATGEKQYRELAHDMMMYLRTRAPRFGDHVLQHTVSQGNDFPQQAWADTLFMAALFMLRAGVAWQDEELIDDALNQYAWHIRYLQNRETGLWYHGYDHLADNHMSGVYWGRANAWGAYTMAKAGTVLPKGYLYPAYMDIVGSLNEQLSALKTCQTENGLWRTILDDPESYEEVSASCGIAAAMALRGNPLHIRYIDRAVSGILQNIAADGRVLNVSGGTAVMRDRAGYRGISRSWLQGWGQGLALAFLAALLDTETRHVDGAL